MGKLDYQKPVVKLVVIKQVAGCLFSSCIEYCEAPTLRISRISLLAHKSLLCHTCFLTDSRLAPPNHCEAMLRVVVGHGLACRGLCSSANFFLFFYKHKLKTNMISRGEKEKWNKMFNQFDFQNDNCVVIVWELWERKLKEIVAQRNLSAIERLCKSNR